MSETTTAPLETRGRRDTADEPTVLDGDEAVQDVLDVLDDAGCRAILEATGDDALSASELSEECGLSLSSTYRKLDLLTDAGLLAEGTRIRRSGKHTSEYTRQVREISVSVGDDGGFSLTIARSEGADPSVAAMPGHR